MKVSCLAAKAPIWALETCEKWAIHRFVHAARGDRHWLQSVWIATCSCETSRKLTCSRTREEDRGSSFLIEKHFKPICSKITSTTHSVTFRKRWFVKWAMRYSSYAKQLQRCNAQNGFFIGIKEEFIALVDISWLKSESSQNFSQWRLDALSIPHYVIKKGRPHGARHGKTDAQNEHFVAHNADPENRDLQLKKMAGPRRSASRWISWHRKTTPAAHPLRNTWDIGKSGISHLTNQAEMHQWNSDQTSEQQSQLWTVSTKNLEQNDLNQSLFINTKGGIRLLLPVPHGGSGMKTGGAHTFSFVVARSFTADGNLLQPTGGVNSTPSHVTFSRVCAHVLWSVARHWLKCMCASYHPCLTRLCVWSHFDPLFALFIYLSHLLLHLLDHLLHLPCGLVRSKIPCALRRMRSLALWSTTLLSHLASHGWRGGHGTRWTTHERLWTHEDQSVFDGCGGVAPWRRHSQRFGSWDHHDKQGLRGEKQGLKGTHNSCLRLEPHTTVHKGLLGLGRSD